MSVTAAETATAAKWNRDTKAVIARARRTSNSPTSASTTLVAVLRIDDIPLTSGRLYGIESGVLAMDGSVAADVIRAQLVYTTDGSTPTISSTALPGGMSQGSQANIAQSEHRKISTTYTPASDVTLSLLLCVCRAAGTGTVGLYADGAINIIEFWVTDLGVDPGDTGVDA